MGYKHLTFIQRCEIYGLWRAGLKQTEIATKIGVHKSTICKELKRNALVMGLLAIQTSVCTNLY